MIINKETNIFKDPSSVCLQVNFHLYNKSDGIVVVTNRSVTIRTMNLKQFKITFRFNLLNYIIDLMGSRRID